jgi:hypothetical protein
MTIIFLAGTTRTPAVEFDFETNQFALLGESYPEDVSEFYGPVIEPLEAHLRNQKGAEISFRFEFLYFNSGTAKIVMQLFSLLEQVAANGNKVAITWGYEKDDDNIQEIGEEFAEELKCAKFILKELSQ